MSVKAMAWAFEQEHVPPTARFVLVAMADYADHAGMCWPSVASIQAKTGLSERAVRGALRTLEDKGVIALLANRLGGRATTPRYQLAMAKGAGDAPYSNKRGHDMPPNGHVNGASPAPFSGQNRLKNDEKGARRAVKGAGDAPEPSRTVSKSQESPFIPHAPPTESPAEKIPLPDWTPPEWEEWETYRLAVGRRTWTPQVRQFSLASLDALRREGHDPGQVIRQAIAGGFTGFRPLPRPPAPQRETVAGYFARQRAAGLLEDDAFADLDFPPPVRRLQ